MWWWVALVGAVVLTVLYVTWLAGRIERAHARAAAAQAALDAHLVRRAAAAVEAAEAAGDSRLRWAAKMALEASAEDRETAENDLTRALRPVLLAHAPSAQAPQGGNGGAAPALPAELVRASRRVALARQVHNDLVRDALALRRRRLVRVLRLTRRHPLPAYFDVDDPAVGAA